MIDNDEGALGTLLRDASGDAVRTVQVPDFETIVGRARRRRAGRLAAGTTFAVVVCLTLIVGITAEARRDTTPAPLQGRPTASAAAAVAAAQAAARAAAADPELAPTLADIPILVWTEEPGAAVDQMAFIQAVFQALPGDRDTPSLEEVRARFPDAPHDGPGLTSDQSATVAQFQQAAVNINRLAGIKDARVIVMPGMWFTVKAVARKSGVPEGGIDTEGLPAVSGWAGGSEQVDGVSRTFVRLTYCGPAILRQAYDLIRERVGQSVQIDGPSTTVKPESSR
jgi:hypothetical protein